MLSADTESIAGSPLEASVKARWRPRRGHEIPLEADGWADVVGGRTSPEADAEGSEPTAVVRYGIAEPLILHRRTVLVAPTRNGRAERLGMTRGALYTKLHDARRTPRARRPHDGLGFDSATQRRRA
jgi:hypothetical protein